LNSIKKSDYFLSISVLAIISLWIIVSFYNRLVDDDLIMVASVKELGVWGSMIHFYNGWNTRWAAYLLQCSFYQFWSVTSKPIYYNLLTLLFMVISSYALINSFLKKTIYSTISKTETLKLSILFFGGLIITTYHIGDTWFWVSGSTMYGWNLGCGILILSILFDEFKWWQFPILILLGLFIGGAAEPFAICFLIASLQFLFRRFKQKNKFPIRLITTSIAIAVSFGIAFAGKGHDVRSELLPKLGILEIIGRTGFFSLKLILWHSPFRIIASILLFIPFYILGQKNKLTLNNNLFPFLKNKVLPILFIWIEWVIAHCLLITKLMGNYGPPRAWSSISLLTAIIVAYLMFEAGRSDLFQQLKNHLEEIKKKLKFKIQTFNNS